MLNLNDNQFNALTFMLNIANTRQPDAGLAQLISIGFNVTWPELVEIMPQVTEQAYNGLNQDCGEWASQLTAVVFQLAYSNI